MDIITQASNLPTKIEDLSRFVLVGREKMVSVRAEIRAIDKLGLGKEVRQQKLDEGQMIADALLDAEVRLGELMRDIPKASGGDRKSENFKLSTDERFEKPKEKIIVELGFNHAQAQRFETLAKYPEVVAQAKAEARANDDIVSRSLVLTRIKDAGHATETPHVSNNSGENEWYTPIEFINAAREVMGSIDLDPASCEAANKTVKATKIFTIDDDGLKQHWRGNVWLNPPYASDLIGKFADKVAASKGDIQQAIILVNNATETGWFNTLVGVASAVVFPKSRVKFYMADGKTGAPLQGQAFIYVGDNPHKFLDVFKAFGWGAIL
ncbi:MAG: DNA N-6-adenine-methyltransferase [Candidatus Sumerlaeales bacterium]|nr:DNA N-6-adenine-methyltransferase [Candidatus Sumerlaeales bacterium]